MINDLLYDYNIEINIDNSNSITLYIYCGIAKDNKGNYVSALLKNRLMYCKMQDKEQEFTIVKYTKWLNSLFNNCMSEEDIKELSEEIFKALLSYSSEKDKTAYELLPF